MEFTYNRDLFYYLVYDESVTQLCNRINTNALTCGRRYNIEKENDIILAHAIYKIAYTTHLYRKDDIKSAIWTIVMPLCDSDDSLYSSYKMKYFQAGFDDLFDYCWEQKFSRVNDEKKAVKLSKIAYRNRTFLNRLINSNLSIILFSILFFAIEYWINQSMLNPYYVETHEILLTALVIFLGIYTTGAFVRYHKSDGFYAFPLICAAIMCAVAVYDLFNFADNVMGSFKADITLQIVKRDLNMGISYILWYPIIYFNKDRLYDFRLY